MTNMIEKKSLRIMDETIHALWRTNPVAYELKRASHRKGGIKHNEVLRTAFLSMFAIVKLFSELYEKEASNEGSEVPAGDESSNSESS